MLTQATRKRSAVPHCGKIGSAGLYVVCCKHRPQRLENLSLLKVVFYFPFAQQQGKKRESAGPAVHMPARFEFSGTRSTYIVLFLLKVSG